MHTWKKVAGTASTSCTNEIYTKVWPATCQNCLGTRVVSVRFIIRKQRRSLTQAYFNSSSRLQSHFVAVLGSILVVRLAHSADLRSQLHQGLRMACNVKILAWCSEIGSLTSLNARELHASVTSENQFNRIRLYILGVKGMFERLISFGRTQRSRRWTFERSSRYARAGIVHACMRVQAGACTCSCSWPGVSGAREK